jgi:glycosyltransferase involved in cell wall biosynthesis
MPSELTVLVVATLPPPQHGQSIVTAEIVEALSHKQCHLTVVDTSPRSLQRSFKYHFIRAERNISALAIIAALRHRSSRRLYSVVESSFGIVYNFVLIAACRLLGVTVHLHHHTAKYCKTKSTPVLWLSKLAGRRATHIFLSDEMKADYRLLYSSAGRALVVHNARNVSFDGLRGAVPEAGSAALRLGLLSNLSAEKGLDVAIDTFVAATMKGLDVKLLLAGPLSGRAAEKSVADARSRHPNIEYWGPLEGEAKARFYRSIDVFLFPTQYKYEAQPLVVLEAMAAGLPVIVSGGGYISELVEACGVVVGSAQDYREIALAELDRWSCDRAALREAGMRCAARFAELKAVSTMQFDSLIDELSRP